MKDKNVTHLRSNNTFLQSNREFEPHYSPLLYIIESIIYGRINLFRFVKISKLDRTKMLHDINFALKFLRIDYFSPHNS